MRSFQQIRWMVAALAFFVLQGLPSEMGKTDATRVPFQILPLGVSEADAQTTLPELTIRVIAHLEFGQIAAHPSFGAKARIDPQTGQMTVYMGTPLSSPYGRAVFQVEGEPNTPFALGVPSPLPLEGSTGSHLSEVTTFPEGFGMLGPDGKAFVFVGATLNVPAGDYSAQYTGSVPLFVEYVE